MPTIIEQFADHFNKQVEKYNNKTVGPMRPLGGSKAVGPITQIFSGQSKKQNKRRKTALQKMLMMNAINQNYFITRWQALTDFDAERNALPLRNGLSNVSVTDQRKNMPMYCFNLTNLPFNSFNNQLADGFTRIGNVPAYRLRKRIDPALNTEVYDWVNVPQVNGAPNGGTLLTPNLSVIEWDNLGGAARIQTQKWFAEWHDMKFVFKGAKTRPIKFHMAMCTFDHCGVGPNRRFTTDGSTISTFDIQTAEENQDGCLFWDHFWATRLTNPIRTTIDPKKVGAFKKSNPCRMWAHETFTINNDLTTNKDTNGIQMCYNKRIVMDKAMSASNTERFYKQNKAVIGTADTFGFTAGEVIPNLGQIPSIANNATIMPQYTNEQWLLIWADVYSEDNPAVSGDSGYFATFNTDLTPSFDIRVRAKFNYAD